MVEAAGNTKCKIIDTSTAHRSSPDWVYGFAELEAGQAEKIGNAKRVSNPGCYSLTSIAMLHPLVDAGLLARDWPVTINAVSGYSGGGKSLIAEFEGPEDTRNESTVFSYALGLKHKHLPEIKRWANLDHAPLFEPHVGRYRQGMLVQIPLPLWAMADAPEPARIHAALAEHYEDEPFVEVAPIGAPEGDRLDPECLNGTNKLRLHVLPNPDGDAAVVAGLLDNLGKGASGQAVQTLNMLIGVDEATGL